MAYKNLAPRRLRSPVPQVPSDCFAGLLRQRHDVNSTALTVQIQRPSTPVDVTKAQVSDFCASQAEVQQTTCMA